MRLIILIWFNHVRLYVEAKRRGFISGIVGGTFPIDSRTASRSKRGGWRSWISWFQTGL